MPDGLRRRDDLCADVDDRVAIVTEPFIVPDVARPGEDKATIFHHLRDLVESGYLRHDAKGYWRVGE